MHAKLFETYFDVVTANSRPLLAEVFRLRHQIYCDELGFEPQRASCLEHDEYDERSIHCLLLHKASKTFIGCSRLILTAVNEPDERFPFEMACGESFHWNFDSSSKSGRDRYGEISRLAVIAKFRRFPRNEVANVTDAGEDFYDGDEDERHLFPTISLGLYLAMTAIVLNKGLKGVYAMMEPRLARRLRRLGILFEQVGEAVEHHGLRGPFLVDCDTIMNTLKPDCLAFLGKIQNSLEMPQAQRHDGALSVVNTYSLVE